MVCLAAALAASVAPAAAHQPDAFQATVDGALAGARPGQFVQVPALGPTRRGADGLLEIRLADGEIVKTHGVDPPPFPGGPSSVSARAAAAAPQRGLRCADLPRMRVFYMHPSDRPNRWSPKMRERIRRYMRQMSYRLHADALASSRGRIGADYRIACRRSGRMLIRPLETRTTSARDDWSVIQEDMKRAGLDSPESKYLIWYDDPMRGRCGIGNLSTDDRKSASNRNLAGPRYALVYGNTRESNCWNWQTGMHENAHNMGAVQYDAPRSSGNGWHCNDGFDVMCYRDGGDKSRYTTTRCRLSVFDCGADTYFDTLTERGEWLRSHWNLGWSGNAFLDFSSSPTSTGAPQDVPAG